MHTLHFTLATLSSIYEAKLQGNLWISSFFRFSALRCYSLDFSWIIVSNCIKRIKVSMFLFDLSPVVKSTSIFTKLDFPIQSWSFTLINLLKSISILSDDRYTIERSRESPVCPKYMCMSVNIITVVILKVLPPNMDKKKMFLQVSLVRKLEGGEL